MKPNSVGPEILYLNPGIATLSTTNFAAIDTAFSMSTISPYAYTATVRSDYDAYNFVAEDAGGVIVAGQRVAFGLFLSPDNDKGNLLFQVTGKAFYRTVSATGLVGMQGQFFFGRKATNDTVVSSVVGPENTLAKYMLLPNKSGVMASAAALQSIDYSIEDQVFTLSLPGGFVYCFGFYLENVSGTNYTMSGGVSLAMRKYSSELPAWSPSRI